MNTQEIVRWADENEKQQLVSCLEGLGFKNFYHKERARNSIDAFCVDLKKKEFFGCNVTCAAARAQAGMKTLSADEFYTRYCVNA